MSGRLSITNRVSWIFLVNIVIPYFVAFGLPNDERLEDQWGLWKISAPNAWIITPGDNSILIAIIDSGVDFGHPDLREAIWVNPGEIPNDGVDNDKNGFYDDVHGWDFINNDNDPNDDYHHGTHVAGIVAAIGNNVNGIAGVAWKCKIMPVKVIDEKNETRRGAIANGIRYAAKNGAQIINLSLHSPTSEFPDVREAVKEAYDKGCVLVGSSGNDDEPTVLIPAAYREVIAVGATDEADTRARWTWAKHPFRDFVVSGDFNRLFDGSNYGLQLDVVAPGKDILSTVPDFVQLIFKTGYEKNTGTSMAAPHVSGEAALILSKYSTWTPGQVMAQIMATADKVPGMNGQNRTDEYGYGRINVYRALTEPPPFPLITSSLQLTPSPPYYTGDVITASYTVTNRHRESHNFEFLAVASILEPLQGGTNPTFNPLGGFTLNTGQSRTYQGEITVTQPGTYQFSCAYKPAEAGGDWVSKVALDEGLTIASREIEVTVSNPPVPPISDLSLMRVSGSKTMYLFKNRKRYKILNDSQLENLRQVYNFTGKDYTLSQETLNQYPPGPDILTNGFIIKSSDSPGIYLIQNGNKRTFSAQGYLERGYNRFEDIEAGDPNSPTYILIPRGVKDVFPLGRDIPGGTANVKMHLYFKKNGKIDNDFYPGDTKESILDVEGDGYTVRSYLKVIYPEGRERYAHEVSPYSLDFTEEKRPLKGEAWNVDNPPSSTFNTYTLDAGTDLGKWTWKIWLEDINRPGLVLASATASYFVYPGKPSQVHIATAGEDGVLPTEGTPSSSGNQSGGTSTATVWPGDTNNDGRVSIADVLPIGLYWHESGQGRGGNPCDWIAQAAVLWNLDAATYADASGDGTVDEQELACIGVNWNKAHALAYGKPTILAGQERGGLSVRVDLSATGYILTVNAREVENLFGVSFVLHYYPTNGLQPTQVKAGSFLGEGTLFFFNSDELAGEVAIAITRKAGQAVVSGDGPLAHIELARTSIEESRFWVSQAKGNDAQGNAFILATDTPTLVAREKNEIPRIFALAPSYPNPFNASAIISYDLPTASQVRLVIYNILGHPVRQLLREWQTAGSYRALWNGQDDQGRQVASGVYLCRLETEGFMQARRMVLLR